MYLPNFQRLCVLASLLSLTACEVWVPPTDYQPEYYQQGNYAQENSGTNYSGSSYDGGTYSGDSYSTGGGSYESASGYQPSGGKSGEPDYIASSQAEAAAEARIAENKQKLANAHARFERAKTENDQLRSQVGTNEQKIQGLKAQNKNLYEQRQRSRNKERAMTGSVDESLQNLFEKPASPGTR